MSIVTGQSKPPFSHVGFGKVIHTIPVGKSWIIEVEKNERSIQGYITNCVSAKTYEYAPEWRGAIFIAVGPGGTIPPVYVYNQLAALLEKEFRAERPELFEKKESKV